MELIFFFLILGLFFGIPMAIGGWTWQDKVKGFFGGFLMSGAWALVMIAGGIVLIGCIRVSGN